VKPDKSTETTIKNYLLMVQRTALEYLLLQLAETGQKLWESSQLSCTLLF